MVIFDDLVFSNKKISEFFTKSRKLNASCVSISHRYFSIDRLLRNSLDFVIFTKLDKREIKLIYDSISLTTLLELKQILNDKYYDKLLELNKMKTSAIHNKSLTKQAKKFSSLISEFNLPYLSPYQQIQSFNINVSTISGPLKYTTPSIKPEDTKRTVINLSDTSLEPNETEHLSLGLKFCPTDLRPNMATIASKIEPTTRAFDPAIEHAIANDVTAILQKPSKPISNFKPHLSKALQTLRQKKTTLKSLKPTKEMRL